MKIVLGAIAVAVLLLSAPAEATVMGDADLLEGNGCFDTAAQQASWTLSTKNARSEASFGTTFYTSAPYGLNLYGAVSSGGSFGDWAQAATTFSTVANRAHIVVLDGRLPNNNSSRLYVVVNDESLSLSCSTTNFPSGTATSQTFEYAPQVGDGTTSYSLVVQNYLNNARTSLTGIWVDGVHVYREIASPTVSAQSVTVMNATQTMDIVLTNQGGTVEDKLIAFDPTAVVQWIGGATAVVNSFTWNSDNEMIVSITAGTGVGNAMFTVMNPYGGQSCDFAVSVIPEPMTAAIVLMGISGIVIRRHR